MLLFYRDRISATILLIPVIAAVQFVFSLASRSSSSAINVFFRDIANVARHALRLWFYLSPALYAFADVAGEGHGALRRSSCLLNPWTPLFESYRAVIYNGSDAELGSAGVLLVGVARAPRPRDPFFKRVEPSFAKVL